MLHASVNYNAAFRNSRFSFFVEALSIGVAPQFRARETFFGRTATAVPVNRSLALRLLPADFTYHWPFGEVRNTTLRTRHFVHSASAASTSSARESSPTGETSNA